MKKLRVAGIQMSGARDKDENIKRAECLISVAAEEGASIVCLPELFNTGWFPSSFSEENMKLAEKADGPTLSAMSGVAAKFGIVIVAPIFEREGNCYYNTAFILGETGEVLGYYRKVHIPDIPLWKEKEYFTGGVDFPVFETKFAKIGVQICWDIFFPEAARILAIRGAELIFTPTASAFPESRRRWEAAASASSHANGVYIFRVNRVGKEDKQEFYGGSFCVGPYGEFLSRPAGPSEGVTIAEPDLNALSDARKTWPFFSDRRPDIYRDLMGTPE